jgi:hypothetical protein
MNPWDYALSLKKIPTLYKPLSCLNVFKVEGSSRKRRLKNCFEKDSSDKYSLCFANEREMQWKRITIYTISTCRVCSWPVK